MISAAATGAAIGLSAGITAGAAESSTPSARVYWLEIERAVRRARVFWCEIERAPAAPADAATAGFVAIRDRLAFSAESDAAPRQAFRGAIAFVAVREAPAFSATIEPERAAA